VLGFDKSYEAADDAVGAALFGEVDVSLNPFVMIVC
jgi:hypothetical protein